MTERNRERVSGVSGLRQCIETEDAGNHYLHLFLIGSTVASNRRLHLTGRMRGGGQARFGCDEECHAAGLGSSHHRVTVVLRKDSLDSDGIGLVLFEYGADASGDSGETFSNGRVGRRAHDADVNERSFTGAIDINDADTATGQAGVDTEHTQRSSRHSPRLTAQRAHRRFDSARYAPTSILVVVLELGLDLWGEIEVAVDVLHVFAVFEGVD